MHPVARFAHSLKRLFTTCRVFSGSFTGKAWSEREQFKSTLSTTPTHVRTSWCVRRKGWGWARLSSKSVHLMLWNLGLKECWVLGPKGPYLCVNFKGLARDRKIKIDKQTSKLSLSSSQPSTQLKAPGLAHLLPAAAWLRGSTSQSTDAENKSFQENSPGWGELIPCLKALSFLRKNSINFPLYSSQIPEKGEV